jgi:hypothetical protein
MPFFLSPVLGGCMANFFFKGLELDGLNELLFTEELMFFFYSC